MTTYHTYSPDCGCNWCEKLRAQGWVKNRGKRTARHLDGSPVTTPLTYKEWAMIRKALFDESDYGHWVDSMVK